MRTGALLENGEVAAERSGARGVVLGGTEGTPDEVFANYAVRDARLRRIVRSLQAMAATYRASDIPADFPAPAEKPDVPGHWESSFEYEESPGHPVHSSSGGHTPEWADLQGAYERWRFAHGQMGPDYDWDWYYLEPTARLRAGAARGAPRIGGGVPSGAYMVVPDIDGDPTRMWLLEGFTPVPRGATIVELWHDDFGYYYRHGGVRVDAANPWRR